MIDLFLFSLLVLLLTHYGFQPRRRAIGQFKAGWRWQRTAIRVGLWLGYGVLLSSGMPLTVPSPGIPIMAVTIIFLAAALLTEVSGIIQRRIVRSSIENGSPYGSVRSHLSLILVPLIAPIGIAMLLSPSINLAGGRLPQLAGPSVISWIVMFIAMWCWSTLITVSIIDLVRPEEVVDEDDQESTWGRGEVIGILERLITFMLILSGSPAAVALVVAAKSAARFPEFSDEAFAEYFLVGTLTSVGLAVALGLILSLLP